MMPLKQYNAMAAPEVLQLNMEIISKELNDLIVTEDQEYGIAQQFSMTTVKTTAQSFLTAAEQENDCTDISTCIPDTFYGHQLQFSGAQTLSNMTFNPYNYQLLQQPIAFIQPQYSASKSNYSNSGNNVKINQASSRSILGSTPGSLSNSKPTFEFHYLRPRGERDMKLTTSTSSLNGQGAFRKLSKQFPKHFYQKSQNSRADNEEIEFDLSALPLLDNDEVNSNVRRIFDLLHDLYLAITETPISFQEEDSRSQFEETFVSLCSQKYLIPSTLNVQNQVKQACRKLAIFTCEMHRIVSANKVYDSEMHAECEFYLQQLQQYLSQLEMYRGIAMEHRHGKFLREDVNAHAERLSLLLTHTNRQIREVHIRILAADWYIGVKYRGDVHLTATQFKPELVKKSRIGMINEILQMCNTVETESVNYKNTATATSTTEVLKPEKLLNTNKQLLFNEEVLDAKPLLMANNNIFNIYKPIPTKTIATTVTATANATGGQHSRHPVFYIG